MRVQVSFAGQLVPDSLVFIQPFGRRHDSLLLFVLQKARFSRKPHRLSPGWPPRRGCWTAPECRPHLPRYIPGPLFRSRCRSRQIPPGDHKVPLPHLPFDVPLRPVVDLQPASRRMFLLRASASLRSAPASRRGPLFIPAHTCISSTVRHSLRGPTAGTSIFRSHGFGLLAEDKKRPAPPLHIGRFGHRARKDAKRSYISLRCR